MDFTKQLVRLDNLSTLNISTSPDNVFYGEGDEKVKYYREPYFLVWTDNNAYYVEPNLNGKKWSQHDAYADFYDEGGIYKVVCSRGVTFFAGLDEANLVPDFDTINGLFYNCEGLLEISIPDTVTYIGKMCFYDCNRLPEVVIPDSVTELGEDCFRMCTSLSSVTLSNSLTVIHPGTFFRCANLKDIEIPESVEKLENNTSLGGTGIFYECTSLSGVTLHEGLKYIGESTFGECSSLSTITIPDSVTFISSSAFYECSNLTAIYYNGSATGAPWGAYNATVLPNPN